MAMTMTSLHHNLVSDFSLQIFARFFGSLAELLIFVH